jgi:lactaldehyde dehydrogenase/glycolaldehyde dehydrogenase
MTEFVPHFEHYVAGRFVAGEGEIEVLNPATEKPIGAAPEADRGLVDEAVAAAKRAQAGWGRLPANSRAAPLRAMARAVREQLPQLARAVATEQGKLLPLAEMEAFVTAEYLDYMAEWGRRIEGEVIASDRPGEHMFLFRKPMGVVAGILPWNFPLFMVARKLAPALIAGNAIVIKPSEETPYSAYLLAKIAAEAGVPEGVFNLVNGRGASTGDALVTHPDVDMISFTGSSTAGARIMERAAANLTKLNLELGGKAPAIILDDADIDLAVGVLKASKALNSGQACNCAERIYVQRGVADEFREKLSAAMGSIRAGDPLGEAPVDMGPLINRAAVDRISDLIEDARRKGAQVLTGGSAAERGRGFHYEATVLSDTHERMRVSERELFGPVVMVNTIDDLDEGIANANDSEYGLTSSIFTTNLNAALRAVSELKFGETYVNRENFEAIQGFHAGVRKSGIGGTDGKHGLYEYMHTHVAYIQTS